MNFLLINKPEGWTSFDVVGFVRKQLTHNRAVILNEVKDPLHPNKRDSSITSQNDKPKKLKVGHAGTLDPFATGLLIVGVGREATKKLDEFKAMPKTYVATIKLGATSDTYDRTGHITIHDARNTIQPTTKKIKETIKSFTGKQKQIPPMFSAKKINGQRLYDLARKGITVERQPSEIEIYSIRVLPPPKGGVPHAAGDYTWPFLKIEVQCSAGTYIRSLADDIGRKLGTGAYCDQLVRTKIGDYSLDNAVTPQSLLITP